MAEKKDSPPKPSFAMERSRLKRLDGPVAGVDEAGRGPWAGPVVAAAVILDPERIPAGLDDSKRLKEADRERLFETINATATVGIGIADVARIDSDNILHATMWAMGEAIQGLGIEPALALIDGNRCPPCRVATEAIVKGDAKSVSIAAASIIAKVTRDRMMRALAQDHPGYGWERNKGYGTRDHISGIETLGVTRHHRRSFRPIQDALEKEKAE